MGYFRIASLIKMSLMIVCMVLGLLVIHVKETYAIANIDKIIPTPQQVTYTESFVTLHNGTTFSAAIVMGSKAPQSEIEGAQHLKKVISRLAGANIPIVKDSDNLSSYTTLISIGTTSSNTLNASLVSANAIVIPDNREGYAIEKVTNGTQQVFVIAGKEAIGNYYGSTSLAQMLKLNGSNTELRIVSIQDYPSIRVRAFKDMFTQEGYFSFGDSKQWLEMLPLLKANVFSYCYTHLSVYASEDWRNPSVTYKEAVKDIANFERDRGIISVMQDINPGFGSTPPANTAEQNQLIRTYKFAFDEGGSQAMLGFDDQSSAAAAGSHRDLANLLQASYDGQEDMYLLSVPEAYYSSAPDFSTYINNFTNGLNPKIGAGWSGNNIFSSYVTPAMVDNWRLSSTNPLKIPFFWHNDEALFYTRLNMGWQPTHYYFTDQKVPFMGVNLNGGYIWKYIQDYTSNGVIENIFRQTTAHKIYAIAMADWMWNPGAYENTSDEFYRAKRYWDTIVSNPAFMKTATASSQYSAAYAPGLAVDGLNSSEVGENVWASAVGQPTVNAWWKVDLGKKQDMTGLQIRYRQLENKAYMVPSSVTVQVSDNNVDWKTVVKKATNLPVENAAYDSSPYTYSFNANGRYVRLLFEDGGQNILIELSEVDVLTQKEVKPTVQNNLSLNATASASSVNAAGFEASKAVDGTVSTDTVSNAWASSTSVSNAWWKVDLGGKSQVNGVDVSFRQVAGAAYMVPRSITFQTSDDNVNWKSVVKKDTDVPMEGAAYSSAQKYRYDVRGTGRYVRLLFEDGSQNSRIELSEVTVNSDNLALRKTATASTSYSGYGASLANDGQSSDTTSNNAWATALNSTAGSWWKVDLGATRDFKTVKVKFREYPSGIAYAVPSTMTIQTSSDNVNWTTLIARTARVPAPNSTYASATYSYAVNGQGRYVRLLFEDGAPDVLIELSEVEITNTEVSEHQKKTADIAYGKLASASSTYSTAYSAKQVVDGKSSRDEADNAWATAGGTQANSWWKVDLGKTGTISKVQVVFREYPYNIAYMIPKNITFQISNDGSTWTNIISKSTNVPTTGAVYVSQPYSYTLNTSGRFIRLLFEDGGQDSLIELSEVKVFN